MGTERGEVVEAADVPERWLERYAHGPGPTWAPDSRVRAQIPGPEPRFLGQGPDWAQDGPRNAGLLGFGLFCQFGTKWVAVAPFDKMSTEFLHAPICRRKPEDKRTTLQNHNFNQENLRCKPPAAAMRRSLGHHQKPSPGTVAAKPRRRVSGEVGRVQNKIPMNAQE